MEKLVNEDTTPLGTHRVYNRCIDPKANSNVRARARHNPGSSNMKRNGQGKQPEGIKNKNIKVRLASWNVGTMTRKSLDIEDVMLRRNLDFMMVQETKWSNLSNKTRYLDLQTKAFKLYFHGVQNGKNGVGVIMAEKWEKNIISVVKISDRLMAVKVVIENEIWNLTSVYAPQVGCSTEEKDEFWLSFEAFIMTIPTNEYVFVGGDLNGHVGALSPGNKRWHGGYGYGTANNEGESIIHFAKAHDLVLLNTMFKKGPEHLITYRSGRDRTQIDFHMCSRQVKKYVKDCKIIPGESAVTQHRLLVSEVCIKRSGSGKDTSAKVKKIKWFKMESQEGEQFMERMEEWLNDVMEAKEDLSADEYWNAMQEVCLSSAKKLLGVSKGPLRCKKEAWLWKYKEVREAVANKKEAFKAVSTSDTLPIERQLELEKEYIQKKKESTKVVAKARAEESESLYESLETPEGQQRIFKMAANRRYNARSIPAPKYINDVDGNLLTCNKDICQRFKEYFEQLLNEEFPRNTEHNIDPVWTEIEDFSQEEIKQAIIQMKTGKAVGPDGIPAEFWKKSGQTGIEFLQILFNKIKMGDKMPNAFRTSFLLPFYKRKGDSRDCGNYRAIKLMSHTKKIWERVNCNRIMEIVIGKMPQNQCGFVPERSTSDAIQALRITMEKYRDAKQDLHIVFIDFEKAFDRIPRSLIWVALRYYGVPEPYVEIIKDMYENVTTSIRCNAGTSEAFNVLVGVHQGSVLSPLLFILVLNFLMDGKWDIGLLNLAFADDLALIDDNLARIQETLNTLQQTLEGNGFRISRTKTEYMYCPFQDPGAPPPDLMLDSVIIPRCTSFKYLGSVVTSEGSCIQDVNHRVSVAWLKWLENSSIFCDRRLPNKLKGRLHSQVVRPTLLYGAKCWTFYNEYIQKLIATDMKMLRMAAGVTKKDKIKSEHIRGSLQVKDNIQERVTNERANWFERVYHQDSNHVAKRALNLQVAASSTRRGRKKNSWEGQLKQHQIKYGLTNEERNQISQQRSKLRSSANPGNGTSS